MPDEELKPCPFCGKACLYLGSDPYEGTPPAHAVECLECATLGPTGVSADAARAAWNRRASD